jgi:hypothetical protein
LKQSTPGRRPYWTSQPLTHLSQYGSFNVFSMGMGIVYAGADFRKIISLVLVTATTPYNCPRGRPGAPSVPPNTGSEPRPPRPAALRAVWWRSNSRRSLPSAAHAPAVATGPKILDQLRAAAGSSGRGPPPLPPPLPRIAPIAPWLHLPSPTPQCPPPTPRDSAGLPPARRPAAPALLRKPALLHVLHSVHCEYATAATVAT